MLSNKYKYAGKILVKLQDGVKEITIGQMIGKLLLSPMMPPMPGPIVFLESKKQPPEPIPAATSLPTPAALIKKESEAQRKGREDAILHSAKKDERRHASSVGALKESKCMICGTEGETHADARGHFSVGNCCRELPLSHLKHKRKMVSCLVCRIEDTDGISADNSSDSVVHGLCQKCIPPENHNYIIQQNEIDKQLFEIGCSKNMKDILERTPGILSDLRDEANKNLRIGKILQRNLIGKKEEGVCSCCQERGLVQSLGRSFRLGKCCLDIPYNTMSHAEVVVCIRCESDDYAGRSTRCESDGSAGRSIKEGENNFGLCHSCIPDYYGRGFISLITIQSYLRRVRRKTAEVDKSNAEITKVMQPYISAGLSEHFAFAIVSGTAHKEVLDLWESDWPKQYSEDDPLIVAVLDGRVTHEQAEWLNSVRSDHERLVLTCLEKTDMLEWAKLLLETGFDKMPDAVNEVLDGCDPETIARLRKIKGDSDIFPPVLIEPSLTAEGQAHRSGPISVPTAMVSAYQRAGLSLHFAIAIENGAKYNEILDLWESDWRKQYSEDDPLIVAVLDGRVTHEQAEWLNSVRSDHERLVLTCLENPDMMEWARTLLENGFDSTPDAVNEVLDGGDPEIIARIRNMEVDKELLPPALKKPTMLDEETPAESILRLQNLLEEEPVKIKKGLQPGDPQLEYRVDIITGERRSFNKSQLLAGEAGRSFILIHRTMGVMSDLKGLITILDKENIIYKILQQKAGPTQVETDAKGIIYATQLGTPLVVRGNMVGYL